MGSNTIASGNLSTAMGLQTTAESSTSFAIGRCNVGGGNPGVWVDADPLFEIGIGNPANPNNIIKDNAMTVLKNGKVGIGTENPNASLEVNGDIILGESGTRFMEMREFTGTTSSTVWNITVSYPSGWNKDNTRIISCEIQNDLGTWYGVSHSYNIYGYVLNTGNITISYGEGFKNNPYRVVAMRMP